MWSWTALPISISSFWFLQISYLGYCHEWTIICEKKISETGQLMHVWRKCSAGTYVWGWVWRGVCFSMAGLEGYTHLMGCACGHALCEQRMLHSSCIQFSEKEIKTWAGAFVDLSVFFIGLSTMHTLSLPDLFQGSFIMTEIESLFPRSRIQNASVCHLRETILSALFMHSR